MKELYDDMDDKSRDAAQKIRIAFDESTWDKMEALLNEEDRKPAAPVISNTLTAGKEGHKNRRWFRLFLVLFVTTASVYFIKNLKNKTLPLVNVTYFFSAAYLLSPSFK